MLNEYDYMFGEMPEMIRIEKTDILKKAQNELWRSKFWEKSFFDVVNRHCYQSDYYLLKQPLTFNDVDTHLCGNWICCMDGYWIIYILHVYVKEGDIYAII